MGPPHQSIPSPTSQNISPPSLPPPPPPQHHSLLSQMDFRHHNNHHRRPSSDRFLTTFSTSPPSTDAIDDDLNEDDIIFSNSNFHNPPSTSSPPIHRHNRHHQNHHKSFNLDTFGILAALPESDENRISIVNNNKSVISPPAPPSRMIPKPSVDRQIFSLKSKYHQSAPINVPYLSAMMEKRRRFDDVDGEEEDDDDGEMLPPHEMVALRLSKTPVLSCSVLEGAGRTLKGRDLRQVRNAVFRQTGFID